MLYGFALPLSLRWITVLALLSSTGWLVWQGYAVQTERRHLLLQTPKPPTPLTTATAEPSRPAPLLATADIANAITARLSAIAAESGLALNLISINPAQSNGGLLQQVGLSTQLMGTYGASKIFMAKALTEFPNLSINRVAQQRERDQVRTDIQWTLFIGGTL